LLDASSENQPMTTPEQKKSNFRMAMILLSVVLVFFVGFMAKMIWMVQ
jgi:hypothetical protein